MSLGLLGSAASDGPKLPPKRKLSKSPTIHGSPESKGAVNNHKRWDHQVAKVITKQVAGYDLR